MSVEADTSPRERILRAAAALLAEGGRSAVSTRAVSAIANVQAQTIYRQFGDMQGLLLGVAERGFALYLELKTADGASADPVEDVRRGWDVHVEFGLNNPAMYAFLYGDPQPEAEAAIGKIEQVLEDMLREVAAAGRLLLPLPQAKKLLLAASRGAVLYLIAARRRGEPVDHTDPVSTVLRDVIMTHVAAPAGSATGRTPEPDDRASAAQWAVSLAAVLPQVRTEFTAGEYGILEELIDRVADRSRP